MLPIVMADIRNTPKTQGSRPVEAIRLEEFLPYRLSVLSNTVSRGLARAYIGRFGLTIPEWRMLAVLARFAPASAQEVADRSAMDKVRVSRAVSRLMERGLVERVMDAEDRRRSQLSLSEAGWTIYGEIAPAARQVEEEIYAVLEEGERAEFNRLLTKLQRHAAAIRR